MAKFTTSADFTRRLRTPDRSPNKTLMTPTQANQTSTFAILKSDPIMAKIISINMVQDHSVLSLIEASKRKTSNN